MVSFAGGFGFAEVFFLIYGGIGESFSFCKQSALVQIKKMGIFSRTCPISSEFVKMQKLNSDAKILKIILCEIPYNIL